ncbi:MAG: DUF1080 domain-containing protein [Planctomycetota bacterium]
MRRLSLFLLLCLGCTDNLSPPAQPVSTPVADTPVAESPVAIPESAPPTEPVEFIAPPLSAAEISAGWVSLFDGASLYGWQASPDTNWKVSDGHITADSGDPSLLLTPYTLDDFEFRCDFLLAPGGNSGIFLRTADNPGDPAVDTYELNICDSHPSHRTGSLVGRYFAPNVPAVEGAWHKYVVRCEGPRIQVWLDGKSIVDYTDQSAGLRLTGRIGLQYREGQIAFRDVCIRPLGLRPLFNGSDSSGWRTVPGSKATFEVRDGLLHISGGPGFLETEQTFQDFALKASARINGEGLNGGIFFRAEPGTAEAPSNGYELQLSNQTKNGDQAQPADFGTGAIFRRAPARRIVATDNDFFTVVLIAQADQFASWVNGWQVMAWKDQRPDDSNPRKGRRLRAGHISLQGHDPGTSIDFQSIHLDPLKR